MYNPNQKMTLVGENTPRAVVHKSESHKLHQAFSVTTGKSCYQGQLVVLDSDGTIHGFEASDSMEKVIGVAITDSLNPAYTASQQHGPVEVTVAVNGYAIVFGIASEAITSAGPVVPEGTVENGYAKYKNTGVSAEGGSNVSNAIALHKADAGDLIQILIK